MENELYHHGVRGQKWGVRRTPAQLGKRSSSKKSSSGTSNKKTANANKAQKGKAYVSKKFRKQALTVAADVALVASGALWVASALPVALPVAAALNLAAGGTGLASTAASLKIRSL